MPVFNVFSIHFIITATIQISISIFFEVVFIMFLQINSLCKIVCTSVTGYPIIAKREIYNYVIKHYNYMDRINIIILDYFQYLKNRIESSYNHASSESRVYLKIKIYFNHCVLQSIWMKVD